MSSPALLSARRQLAALQAELVAAQAEGLAEHPLYRAELDFELEAAKAAYVAAAVTEIASFRAQLSGPQVG